MKSSDNLPVVDTDEERGDLVPDDELPALRARAMAALRQCRLKANGNAKKTRLTVEVVADECAKAPADSRIMRTLRLDPKKVLEGLSEPSAQERSKNNGTGGEDCGEAAGDA